jgi:uncharacterized protein YjbJ (UPF0337 family)
MNSNELEGKWEQLKGQIKEKWGKLTNDDIVIIKGKKEQLIGKLRERYGYTSDQASKELGSFMKECSCSPSDFSKSKSQPTI